MTTQELAQKILDHVNQYDGLAITLSGKGDDIIKFWQILHEINRFCQEEVNKQ